MSESPLRLSQLLDRVRQVLDQGMEGPRWIVAEILELNVNRSGHCYMELVEKEEGSDVLLARTRATIWASRFGMLRPFFESATGSPLRSGIKILCKASVSFHSQYGFSLSVTDLDPSYTLGDLARKKQEVIRKLREEGVYDMNRDLPFPRVPQRIAVISSDTAAGYGDFMDSLVTNGPGFAFASTLFPAQMQGDGAVESIRQAFDRIFESVRNFDLVVLLRGGGSKADLECFNAYELAYYITQFPLPVCTGIGHERDESVADLVAARALKPPPPWRSFSSTSSSASNSGCRNSTTGSINRCGFRSPPTAPDSTGWPGNAGTPAGTISGTACLFLISTGSTWIGSAGSG
ncbi:MAG: exodeoxyribonuclease VII large subunit [Bacteroidales bacterium]